MADEWNDHSTVAMIEAVLRKVRTAVQKSATVAAG